GACTVNLDGIPRRSCVTPVSAAVGHAITTIEGIGATSVGKKVQQAWLDLEVVQCGYCQSGQIMAATALLAKNPSPTDTDLAQETASVFAPNAFIRIGTDGRVTLIMGQVEMGQGMYTAMPQLLAEELEVGLDQVRLEHAPPDEKRYANPLFHFQATGGSTSVMGLYEPMRRAGATARTMLIAAAAEIGRAHV